MLRRMLCGLMVFGVLLGNAMGASAAGQTGTICISLGSAGEKVTSGAVTLYRVGETIDGGYRLGGTFGGGLVTTEDADSPALAGWLTEQAEESGTTLLLDADGRACFSGLEEGLYLLVQTEPVEGYSPMEAFLVRMPREGDWEAEAQPKTVKLWEESPKTGQHPAPVLAAMALVAAGLGLSVLVDKIKKSIRKK